MSPRRGGEFAEYFPRAMVGSGMTNLNGLPLGPKWLGVNHLALVTPDMDATTRFYVGVLGMRVVETLMAGPMRHYFFEIGPGNTVAFFEIVGAETFQKSAGGPAPYPTQLDHISFNVADEEALHALRARLRAADTEVTRIVDHGNIQSIYFTDNNGIALEASYWAGDPTVGEHDFDGVYFQDPDPVPAIAELQAGGLTSVPATKLT
jgi:catechol 2,3-dioxygenase-like lactoylglutathione lyase family enzyme